MKIVDPKFDLESLEWIEDGCGSVRFGIWVGFNELVDECTDVEYINEKAEEYYNDNFARIDGLEGSYRFLSDLEFDLAGINTETKEILVKVIAKPES